MKKSNVVLITSLILVFTLFLFCKSFVYANQFFDGTFDKDDGDYFGNSGNIPMPGDPYIEPSSYSNSTSTQSTQTYSKPTYHAPSFQTQMQMQIMGTIFDSILQAQQQAQQKAQWEAQQAAIEAQKKAEEAKKQAALKKKLETQKWLYDYQNDTSVVKIDKNQTKIMSLKDDDPYGPKSSSKLKTLKGKYDTSSMSTADRAKCGAWLQNKANYANQSFGLAGSDEGNFYLKQKDLLIRGEPIDVDCGQVTAATKLPANIKQVTHKYQPPLSEDKLRKIYAKTVEDLNKCAAEQNCSPEHVENLNKIQIKAEQELVSNYGIKGE